MNSVKNKVLILITLISFFFKENKCLNSTTFINSTILTQELGVSLMNLIGVPLNSQATKIYQASLHGFAAAQFHSKVDGKLGSLSIIKSTNGNIFGGFTKLSWGSSQGGAYYNDPSSFIFSLTNQKNFPCKLNTNATLLTAVLVNSRYGYLHRTIWSYFWPISLSSIYN